MSLNTYQDFQAMESSEKEGLVILEASKRLIGWVVHSGSVYKLTNFSHPVFAPTTPVRDSGVALTSVGSSSLNAGEYYHDRQSKILYLRTSDSVNPNSKFISLTFRFFFSTSGRNLPHDLATGFDVHWLPLLEGTSDFGVELDNQTQIGNAIEGSGSINLKNDQEFWRPIFDKLYFENQRALVYSWNPFLPITEAKLIYRGRVQKKSYSMSRITFGLQDAINELRAPVTLPFLSDVVGARIPDSLSLAFQRRLYGYVFGHRPTNIDQELEGYPLTGTISLANGAMSITGSGTAFLAELSPGDQLILSGDDQESQVTIDAITSNTAATITEIYESTSKTSVSATIQSSHPKRYMNREFLIAGHALREPSTTVTRSISTSLIEVASILDILPGDALTIGTEISTVVRISGNTIKLSTSLAEYPAVGTVVTHPAVSNVYLGRRTLTLGVDYTYSASDGTLSLDTLAEFNIAVPTKMRGTIAFTSASRNIVGTGTSFTSDLNPGDWVRTAAQADYFEVLSVTDDLNAVLRVAATYTASAAAIVKRPEVYEEGKSILSCDVLGKTDDGLTTGALLKTAPAIVEDLLTDAGLTSLLSAASFTTAKALTSKRLGLVIPKKFSDKAAPKLRDVINQVNRSDFGSLIQNEDFELEFQILSPDKPSTVTRFAEADALVFTIESDSGNIVKTSRVNYAFREMDPVALEAVNLQEEKTSDAAQYLAAATKEFSVDTLLIDQRDAIIYANRWAFLFEMASAVIKIDTKMQGARLQIGDKVEISHEKMYERVGSNARRKVAAVSRARKSLSDASIELDDLSNAFTRCAVIAENTAHEYVNSPDSERSVTGFVTDNNGMQNNDPETHGINLIW